MAHKRVNDHIRDHLLFRAGMRPTPSIDELRESEWSDRFEQLMRNRLVMGALRYGRIGEPGKPDYDRVGSMLDRLEAYVDTRNREHLVDVANMCLLEFVEGQNYFRALDGDDAIRH